MPLFPALPHYRCAFTLESESNIQDPWNILIKNIRAWIAEKLESAEVNCETDFWKSYFYVGGDWTASNASGHYVRVATAEKNSYSDSPKFWSLRYEHPDTSLNARRWRVDIGVVRKEVSSFRVAMQVSHYLRQGYVGREPILPLPSSPRLVRQLIRSEGWRASSGKEQLSGKPKILAVGEGKLFADALSDQNRECPIIYVSLDRDIGKPLIDVQHLAGFLAGAASIYVAESSDLDQELYFVLGRRLNTWNGMIRIFMPRVRLADVRDSIRHRYFPGTQIMDIGSNEIIDIFVKSVARQALNLGVKEFLSIEDARTIDRESELLRLRQIHADDIDLQEYMDAFDEVNGQLKDKNRALENELIALSIQAEESETRANRMRFERDEARNKLVTSLQQLKNRHGIIEHMKQSNALPSDLLSTLNLIETIFFDKVIFTQEAKNSAGDWNFDHHKAWDILWSMATILHELYFIECLSPALILKEFRDKTKYEIALTESSMTKQDRGLMAIRKQMFNGQEVDISAHLKYGNKSPDLLRVHFYPHTERKLLIIGHCGDHLDTYGTRRRG